MRCSRWPATAQITLATSGLASADRKNKSCVALMGALRAQPALCYADVPVEWVWASASPEILVHYVKFELSAARCSRLVKANFHSSSTHTGWARRRDPRTLVIQSYLDLTARCDWMHRLSVAKADPLLHQLPLHCSYILLTACTHICVLASSNSICP